MEVSTILTWIDVIYPFYLACLFIALAMLYYPLRMMGGLCCSEVPKGIICRKPDSQLCIRTVKEEILIGGNLKGTRA